MGGLCQWKQCTELNPSPKHRGAEATETASFLRSAQATATAQAAGTVHAPRHAPCATGTHGRRPGWDCSPAWL